jgi:hypothetical protein
MPRVARDSVVVRNKELVFREVDGETVMLSVETGKYYGLDPVGGKIWELIEQPMAVSELCARLLEEFDVELETCEQDVLCFLNQLAEEQIVVTVASETD